MKSFNLDKALQKNDATPHTAWESLPAVSVAPAKPVVKPFAHWDLIALFVICAVTAFCYVYSQSAGDAR